MKIKITSIIFLFFTIALIGNAQEPQDKKQAESSSKFCVYSITLNSGWYKPEMDYWNDTYLPSQGVTEDFEGSFTMGGNITFALPANFRVRAGVSYWKDKVKGNANSTINDLKIAFTRFRLGALYVPKNTALFGAQIYFGAEGQFFIIKNKLDFGSETTEQEGQDYSFVPLIGIERSFGHFLIGVEFMYNLGSYTQDVNTGTSVIDQKISIDGPEVGISVGYKF
jgi:hypothetical protein